MLRGHGCHCHQRMGARDLRRERGKECRHIFPLPAARGADHAERAYRERTEAAGVWKLEFMKNEVKQLLPTLAARTGEER